ncbi:CrcB family protein [Corynebacterium lujinxingii]|uniref:Fluoride-specific ion channel n=1 Tax=Corynebacterium lujinxingii TaxID=2763010 RepID=A0A7H0JXW8_9CORY|nr:CrcB family protein [Corynebacterium lujinxingii]MBC3179827.1 CrcB family protein [Corynebacterium lujinxingii]NNO11688.1 camphor resistance protein CrcB [Corynebacterium lujinxingii]QNP89884.1 CrcB family protein [Corynebacterium lujinxingii]
MRIDDTFTTALTIALGAALGAVVRHVIILGAAPGSTTALTLTFAVNIAGCFAMGLYKPGPLWGTGFLGGLTTYSAISVAAMQSHALTALIIVVLSYATAVAAWLAGDAVRSRRA